VAKLSDGEDVFRSLEEVARKHGIESGAVHWAIGMLQDFEIGFFAPTGYEKKIYEGRHELLAFHGSIAIRAEPKFHIHVAVSERDHRVIGGHLFRGRVCMVNEVCIERFKKITLTRRLNPKTNLNELQIG
jgi:predicted DNA-binding protein with PD1-like motif